MITRVSITQYVFAYMKTVNIMIMIVYINEITNEKIKYFKKLKIYILIIFKIIISGKIYLIIFINFIKYINNTNIIIYF